MTAGRLVQMANQIAQAFGALPEEQAIASTEDHIRKFWDPRMRKQILTHLSQGGEGLHAVARAALLRLPDAAGTLTMERDGA